MTEHDDKTTEIQPEPDPAPESGSPKPRRLLRSRDDRVIAGVSGGLGRYFDIDPVIVRIAFAVSVLFGGLGVIAYIAAAIFVPSDDGTGAPAPTSRGQTIARGTGLVLLAFVALCGFGTLVAGAAFVTGLGYGLIVAGAIIAIGILLVALSFRGSAKWLIVPALALSIGVGVAAAADLDLEGGVGKRTYAPSSAAAIPADGYELGVGRLAVDLRQIDWSPERRLELDARVGAGEMLIAVPSDVCVVADAHAGAGDIRIAGQQADGFDVDLVTSGGAQATPQLQLDADVDMGAIRVINDEDADIDDQGSWDRWDHLDDGDESLAREANQRACAG
jgi:phage shock protein PspC (stress-responsive transcriptional regulator)